MAQMVAVFVYLWQQALSDAGGPSLAFREWLMVSLQIISLVAVVLSAVKIINRNVREWDVRELRLAGIEKELLEMRLSIKEVVGLPAKLNDITPEIERLRNRLDRFLDIQGGK